MGSIAMDKQGNMALGYSASSASMYPAIRYTGRLATDAVGTMQAETTIVAGTGSQLKNLSRWGDYSAMTVDPVDDCTFWFTSEYLKTNGTWNWSTRIASFKFPGCSGGGGPTTGTLTGTVTDSSNGSLVNAATVSITDGGANTGSTATNSSGVYSFATAVPATYSVTVSKTGYTSQTATGQVVTAGGTTPRDFILVPTSSGGSVPGTPGKPTAATGQGHGVNVSWSAPSNGGSPITGYQLRRYTSCATTPVLSAQLSPGNVLSYKDTGTSAGVAYCYTVAATNANGTGLYSLQSSPVTPTK